MAFEVPAPLSYSPKENLGVTLANTVGSVFQSYQQGKANEANQQFQTAFGQAYANNDYNAMQKLAANHPQQWQTVQQGMTAIQENNRQQLGAASSDLSLAAATGSPDAVMAVAQRHAPTLQGLGIAPEDIATAFQQNPQQVRQYADMLGSHALGPKDYFEMQNKTVALAQQGQYQQGQLQIGQQRTQIQQQQANQTGAYQAAQVQQGAQRLSLDAQMNQIRTADMQLKRQMQKGQMDQNFASKQQASLQAKQQLVDAFDNGNNTLANMQSTLQQVQQIPPETFNGMWGASGLINRNIPGSPEQAAWNNIESMQGQARLMGVIGMKGTGPVSDAEGQAAARAYLAITPSTPAKAARSAINNWNAVLQRQAQYQAQRKPQIDVYRQQVQQSVEQQAAALQGGSGAGVPAGGAAAGGAVDWNSMQ